MKEWQHMRRIWRVGFIVMGQARLYKLASITVGPTHGEECVRKAADDWHELVFVRFVLARLKVCVCMEQT